MGLRRNSLPPVRSSAPAAGLLGIPKYTFARPLHDTELPNFWPAHRNPFSSRWLAALMRARSLEWSVRSLPTSGTPGVRYSWRASNRRRNVRDASGRPVGGVDARLGIHLHVRDLALGSICAGGAWGNKGGLA